MGSTPRTVGPFGPRRKGPSRAPCYRAGVATILTSPHRASGVPASVDPPDRADAAGPATALDVAQPLHARWLGRIDYGEAHALQKRLVDERAANTIGDQLLLLEHPAVLTLGRHSDASHILASERELAERGIGVTRVERGGEVTFHGPGQLVAYPIVGLHDRGLLLRPFVRALEQALAETCNAHGVRAARRDGHPGCWCDPDGPIPRKIGALGLRVERGISYHGIALNVTVDLRDFELIDPCGMPGVVSTSIAHERAEPGEPPTPPTIASVEHAAWVFARAFAAAIHAPLAVDPGDLGRAGG